MLSQLDSSLVTGEVLSGLTILLFMLLLGTVVFLIVRAAIVRGVRKGLDQKTVGSADEPSAEEVLNYRYAGGEISREYLTVRDDITRKQNA